LNACTTTRASGRSTTSTPSSPRTYPGEIPELGSTPRATTRSWGAGERANATTISLAKGVPSPVAIMANRMQIGMCREPRLLFDPGAVSSGSTRRSQVLKDSALEAQGDDRLVRGDGGRLRGDQSDPIADRKRLAQARVPLLPRARADILPCHGEDVEGDEP
jgi:hypothetical protein